MNNHCSIFRKFHFTNSPGSERMKIVAGLSTRQELWVVRGWLCAGGWGPTGLVRFSRLSTRTHTHTHRLTGTDEPIPMQERQVADGEPDAIGKGAFGGWWNFRGWGLGGGSVRCGASLSGSAFQLTLHLIFGL